MIVANLKMINNAVSVYAADNNVTTSSVTQTNLTGGSNILIPTWPNGPKGTSLEVSSGEATATVPASVPGVNAGTYTLAKAFRQSLYILKQGATAAMSIRLKRRAAFTLIELVTVIAILAILAVIALPRLLDLPGKANKRAIVSNLKTINEAADLYASSHGITLDSLDSLEMIADFFPDLPAGPGPTSYTLSNGVATAVVPSGIIGLPAGNYLIADAALN